MIMANYDREQLKMQLAHEERMMDKVIATTPLVLIALMLIWNKFIYDFSFSLQNPLPEYPESIRFIRLSGRGHYYFTRQTILEAIYSLGLLHSLVPKIKKDDLPTLKDYGITLRKLPFLLLSGIMAVVICWVPVLQINQSSAALIYRIGLLTGNLLLTVVAYIVIRVAFKNKIERTRGDNAVPRATLLVLLLIYFGASILLHNLLIK